MATALSRRSPLLDLSEFRGFFEPIFSDVEAQLGLSQRWAPAIDVVRGDGEVTIRADLPGIKPDDVKIEVENDTLTVSGHVEEESEEKQDDFIRRERRYGSFSRTIALPPNVDRNAIDATCKNGVLEVKVPMPEPAEGKVEITPKSA